MSAGCLMARISNTAIVVLQFVNAREIRLPYMERIWVTGRKCFSSWVPSSSAQCLLTVKWPGASHLLFGC